MKIRRIAAMMLAVMLMLSLSICASAEPIAPARTIEVRSVDLNEETNTMAIQGKDSRMYGLYAADGTALTEEKYIHMYASYDMYEVAVESGVNVLGMLDSTGKLVVPMEYGDIEYISDRWQLGVKLTAATADNYDYKSFSNSSEFYLVEAYDVYYCGAKVGSLARSEYYNAYAYGDYLYVSDKERNYTYYNKEFIASGYEGSYSSEYDEKRDGIYHQGSGQQAFVAGCTLTSDEVELDIFEVDGRMVDLQGNVLFALDAKYDYVSKFKGNYAYVSMNSQKGLIDRTGREVMACEYDDISYGETYFEGGYQIAVKDGKVGFVNTDGEVTCEFKYSENNVKSSYKMPLTYLNDLDGSAIVLSGAVGELPTHYAEVRILSTNGCPVFAAKDSKGNAGIINLYGEELIALDGTYDDTYDFQISNDGQLVIGGVGGVYNVYQFTSEQLNPGNAQDKAETQTEEAASADEWKCSNGHANTGKFCSECGEARPIQCSKCGYQPENGTAPKFCSECGNAF